MGECLLGAAAHLSKQASANFQVLLIENSVSISGLYFLHISLWFGSVLDTRLNETDEQLLQNRRAPI